MIHIKEAKDCCGCDACSQVCPQRCIVMKEDECGFWYPRVDEAVCINCHLCERVCPIINQNESKKPLNVYAAKNKDERIRIQSSSGGIFTLIAEQVLREGGVVFGARFNEQWEVVHDYTERENELVLFRGSKYVQSKIGVAFEKAKFFLDNKRKVLFTGTPCQIAGLRKYLRKKYDNLLTVDFICHGVPSPLVWRKYLQEIKLQQYHEIKKYKTFPISVCEKDICIKNISFRSKLLGWKKFSFSLSFFISLRDGIFYENKIIESLDENIFMRGFLTNLYLRPSCYSCQFKSGKSGSDITLGDFWGIDKILPTFDDDKGVSLVLINREEIKSWFEEFCQDRKLEKYENALQENSSLLASVTPHRNMKYFYSKMYKGECLQKCISVSLEKKNIKYRLASILYHLCKKN